MQPENNQKRMGLLAAVGAYTIWGFLPIFFKQIAHVPAFEIVAHRIVWAVPLLLVIMAYRRQLGEYLSILRSWKILRWLGLSALLILANWSVYVWGVNSGQILAVALGYYLNPLLNVLLGTVFLGEKLTQRQWIAVGLAAVAVAVLAAGAFSTLWISLIAAGSFCLYGLVRKLTPVGAVPGLAVETTLLLPVAMAAAYWFAFQPDAPTGWVSDERTMLYLMLGGALTIAPLTMFAFAARRMDYSLLGFCQYIAPSLHFLVGVVLYREELSDVRLIAFGLIWTGLILFSIDALKSETEPAVK